MTTGKLDLESAIEIFVSAFATFKSNFHPYLVDRVAGMWVMHDEDGRKNPRKTEVVTSGKPPEAAVEAVQEAGIGWHFLCDIEPDPSRLNAIRSRYKELGYRAMSSEWMFVHTLDMIPSFDAEPPARLVASQEEADRIPQIASHKLKIFPATRHFRIWDSARDYGFVTSCDVAESAWVQGLYVQRDSRRRGYGKALMSALLRSDQEQGRLKSVLLASSSGAALYPHLGYVQIATLQMFCPLKRPQP